MSSRGWIGVDLDGTLAYYDHWRGPQHIGEPLMPMVKRVRQWLKDGIEVRIFTARVDGNATNLGADEGLDDCRDVARVRKAIEDWCSLHIGKVLPVTNQKDYAMIELWDDRAVQMIPNTGRSLYHDATLAEFVALTGKTANPNG